MWLLILISTLIFLIWRYYKGKRDYWKEKGVQGPPPHFFIGNYLDLCDNKKPHGLVLKEWTKKYGKVYGFKEGVRNILVVSDLGMLQEMFVKKFDDFYGRRTEPFAENSDKDPKANLFQSQGLRWKRLRTICASSFTSNSLKRVKDTVEDSAIELTRILEDHVDSDPIDLHKFYQEYTMDVISRIAMGQNGSKMFKNPLVGLVNKLFNRNSKNPVTILILGMPFMKSLILKIARQFSKRLLEVIKPMFNSVYNAIDERIAQREKDAQDGMEPGEPNDFVDLFLDARADDLNWENTSEFQKENIKISKVLTRDEIVGQCFIFLAAGYDTTSNALSYVSWLLAMNPTVQEKVQKEIDEICGSSQIVSYESLNKLKYTENVIREALRMYPIASAAAARTAMRDTTLGDMKIEEGTIVNADVWSLHYDKEIWGENAEEFVPERWEDEQIRHTTAFLPFGAGPRVCIGMRLAYMEAKLALVHILRGFEFLAGPKTENTLELLGPITVSPASVTIYLKRRSTN